MSKARILDAIRNAKLPAAPLPDLDGLSVPVADALAAFCAALKSASGDAVVLAAGATPAAALDPRFATASAIYSIVPGVDTRGFVPPVDGDPHAFAALDLAVVPGEFGVAENGAIWLSSAWVPHRVCLFLAQHLAIVLSRRAIVADMHAAYARLTTARAPDFGVFIAGPSKTADIEQCLVIGAHGARSLTVLLTD